MNVPGPIGLTMESPGEGPALGRPVHQFSRHFASKGKRGVAITQWNHSHASNERRPVQHDKSLIWPANLAVTHPDFASRDVPRPPDTHDLPGLARFRAPSAWLEDSFRARARDRHRAHQNAPAGRCFLPVTDRKMVKHRVQLDLTSSAADREQETGRLLALGARRADIGQTGAESWTVLANPERSVSLYD
jgi:hypothetical protein